jgi:AcrR family transcriptional regulator
MNLMRKKPYHHGNLRRTLIDASIALMGESGPEAVTLREVASRAKVSHTAPYRHFAEKNDLFAAVAEQGFTELRKAVEEAAPPEKPPLERLHLSGSAYVSFALERTAHFRVMFSAELDPEKHPAARAAAEAAFEALVTVIHACQEARVLSAGETRKKARFAWSLVHGIAHLAIGRQLLIQTREEVVRFVGGATESLVNGLARAKSARNT